MAKKKEEPKYNLWNPPPYEERQKLLDKGFKIDRRRKIDPKKLAAAIAANEKLFECFKPRPIIPDRWLRPICDHD